jgi:hypothetical protein
MSQAPTTIVPQDLKSLERVPSYKWMRAEGIPIYFDGGGMADVTAIPSRAWVSCPT